MKKARKTYVKATETKQNIGVGTGMGAGGLGPLSFFKVGAWPSHFCIGHCLAANIVTDNFSATDTILTLVKFVKTYK